MGLQYQTYGAQEIATASNSWDPIVTTNHIILSFEVW